MVRSKHLVATVMFRWLRKKPSRDPELAAFAEKWIGPQALAVAIAEIDREYTERVASGQVSFPAHRRENESVVGIWRDLRTEVFHNALGFGQADPMLLADQRRQLELLSCFLDDRPHLEMPQPRGEQMADTIQAMWQCYVYLSSVGSEVADRETDSATLKLGGRSILDALTEEAQTLRSEWQAFEHALRANESSLSTQLPRTLLELFFDDVTSKTKSVALSTQFGPSYEAGIEHLLKLVADAGQDVQSVKASIARVMAAKDPDEFAGSGR